MTGFLGGAPVLSVRTLEEIGHWPDALFFAHEETDKAWPAIDAGRRMRHAPRLPLQHPRTSPPRHAARCRANTRDPGAPWHAVTCPPFSSRPTLAHGWP